MNSFIQIVWLFEFSENLLSEYFYYDVRGKVLFKKPALSYGFEKIGAYCNTTSAFWYFAARMISLPFTAVP